MNKDKFSQLEEDILKNWDEKNIFKKSLEQRKSAPVFSFYDGPPFASGSPHLGHILASAVKDTITRYWTMRGYKVERTIGWDCHGLPVENIVEKQLKLKTKKEIESLAETKEKSIEKFNQACQDSVFLCLDEFLRIFHRIGRWADYSNQYATYKNEYIESVWWAFKKLYEKGLVYKDYRVTPYCPHCGTSLSNFEVNQGYRDIEDESAYIKFPVRGEKNTYFLVWTTTPWTLPANLFLAVGKDIDYVKIEIGQEILILAESRLKVLVGGYKILEKIKGKNLLGIEYDPLYLVKGHNYKVVEGDEFVSIGNGTGIVHIAPSFGEIDYQVGKKEGLNDFPINVDLEGKIIKGLNLPGENKFVKDADEDIKQDLKERGLLYKEEKIIHTYPFCWRCDSPLLYYPLENWYIKVTAIKGELIKNNLDVKLKQADGSIKEGIYWMPHHLKEGRFGKWLEGARDWDVSRSRYWGAPLPIWQCEKCKKIKVVGSIDEIKEKIGNFNKLFLVRHAEAENNVKEILNSLPEKEKYHLTKNGKNQAESIGKILKEGKIDLIFSSPILRAKETAEIISKKTGAEIIYDERLKEIDTGEFNGKSVKDFNEKFPTAESRAEKAGFGVETGEGVRKRLKNFLDEINKKHINKNIVIVSHGDPIQIFYGITEGLNLQNSLKGWYPEKGSIKNVYSKSFNLHRPYIDDIIFDCRCGGKMKRVEEVFDCWFESGSMPFAQYHYPFENKEKFEKGFPADFIAEGLDQTRGWFYTLHAIAAGIFNQPAFKNVIVNGLILDASGKKISKKLKNYASPEDIINKFGVDSLRYFLLLSTPAGEDCRFSDIGVEEIYRKTIMILSNVYNFYEMYVGEKLKTQPARQQPEPQAMAGGNLKVKISENILDRWVIAKLNLLMKDLTDYLNHYDLNRSVRITGDFINELSTWYLRRSRARFKSEDKSERNSAFYTLHYVLLTLSKLLAPFLIFLSDEIYQKLSGEKESVHLEDWPEFNEKLIDKELLERMELLREMVELGLAARADGKIKVRQVLNKLKIKNSKFKKEEELINLIKDELNVKEIIFTDELKEEENFIVKGNGKIKIALDIKLTTELKEEGLIRELIRQINTFRKELKLTINDTVNIYLKIEDKELKKIIEKCRPQLAKGVIAKKIELKSRETDFQKKLMIENKKVLINIEKI